MSRRPTETGRSARRRVRACPTTAPLRRHRPGSHDGPPPDPWPLPPQLGPRTQRRPRHARHECHGLGDVRRQRRDADREQRRIRDQRCDAARRPHGASQGSRRQQQHVVSGRSHQVPLTLGQCRRRPCGRRRGAGGPSRVSTAHSPSVEGTELGQDGRQEQRSCHAGQAARHDGEPARRQAGHRTRLDVAETGRPLRQRRSGTRRCGCGMPRGPNSGGSSCAARRRSRRPNLATTRSVSPTHRTCTSPNRTMAVPHTQTATMTARPWRRRCASQPAVGARPPEPPFQERRRGGRRCRTRRGTR